MTIILGIDPGTRITGFGLISILGAQRELKFLDCGCIRTKSDHPMSSRLATIFLGLREIIEQHQPSMVAIEQVFLKQNVMSALKLGHARGAAMASCAVFNLEVSEYSARAVKQAVVGYGAAEKVQVQKMIVDLLKLNDSPSADAADALAVAVCHGFHYIFKRGYQ